MAKHVVLSPGAKLWRSMSCSKSELRLDLTLACGQTFRWRETSDGHWTGVMGGRVWTLTQTDDTVYYHVYTKQNNQDSQRMAMTKTDDFVYTQSNRDHRLTLSLKREEELEPVSSVCTDEEESMLREYFQLNVKLGNLYSHWGSTDPHFKKIANIFSGIRMLRQDPTECLFTFICTSNNHISRIQGMVERLCQSLGRPLCQLDQTQYCDFPSLAELADSSVEARLRDLGFGYRARFLQQSAKQILDTHGLGWLEGLRSVPYLQARDALRTLPGVGTKVADCVCLMSLDKAEAVPIDTHVWQIAKRDYNCPVGNGQKTITEKIHREIGDFFRNLWGPYAGWAQSVLFCADLKKFQKLKDEQTLKREDSNNEEKVPKKKIKSVENRSAQCKKRSR